MGYRSALLFRWSRRDRLAVLVVAVTVAFLTGTALLMLAAGAQTTAIAAEFGAPGIVTHYDSPETAYVAAPVGAIVLPVAEVTLPDGTTGYVVGRPSESAISGFETDPPLFVAETGTTSGDIGSRQTRRLEGRRGTVTVEVTPRGPSILPAEWFASSPSTVDRLGPTEAFVIRPTTVTERFDSGVPLVSALVFFVVGTRQMLTTLLVAAIGGGLLVGVTVYSVTRMSVRDRLPTIRIIRSTGGTPGHVRRLFALRASLLTAIGTALGYAIGVILPSAAVNVAVYAGLPTSLSVGITSQAVRVLLPVILGLIVVGCVAGIVAAWPASRRPPSRLTGATVPSESRDSSRSFVARVRSSLSPTVLGWRALVPTTTTLTAFVLFAVLVSSMAGVAAPLASTGGATITEPAAPHPFASHVPTVYANVLESRGIAASPEILTLEVVDGQPFIARGVNYTAFGRVTDTQIDRGRRPRTTDEALIGMDLARTLGIDVGERVVLGGSTKPAFTRVTVVGTFSAPGPFDDQLLVSLPTARHLSGSPPGAVQFVRTSRLPERGDNATGVGIIDVTTPSSVRANGTLPVRIILWNDALTEQRITVTVRLDSVERRFSVTLPSRTQHTETIRLPTGSPGAYRLTVGTFEQSVRVVDPNTIEFRDLPDRVPPDSHPLVRIVNATGAPVSGATVSVANRTVRTGSDGTVRLPFDTPGEYRITAERGGHTATGTVTAATDARRELYAELRVRPSTPSLLTRPEVQLRLFNPWNITLSRAVLINTPEGDHRRDVRLAPGDRTTITVRLDRRSPGSYTIRAQTNERMLAETTYTVTGDDRIMAALASSGRTRSTGLSRAIETAFGNLQLVLGVILGLAGLMTVGATTATFAQAVHARRQTIGIYRATGATATQLLRIIIGDALVVGMVATGLALVTGSAVAHLLGRAGYLTVFGVRLAPNPSVWVLAGIGTGALGITLFGAALAVVGMLLDRPAVLLSGDRAEGSRVTRGDSRG